MNKPEDFFKYFNKEITFSDTRSKSMPKLNIKGTIIGIRLDSIELRVNNNITNWYPLNSIDIIFII